MEDITNKDQNQDELINELCPTIQMVGLDRREYGFFQLSNELIDVWARIIGINSLGVYNVLSRHCNKNHESWPSIETIAFKLDISESTVKRSLKKLTIHRLIKVVKTDQRNRLKNGKFTKNIYILEDKKLWINTRGPSDLRSETCGNQGSQGPTKNTNRRIHNKGEKILTVDKSAKKYPYSQANQTACTTPLFNPNDKLKETEGKSTDLNGPGYQEFLKKGEQLSLVKS